MTVIDPEELERAKEICHRRNLHLCTDTEPYDELKHGKLSNPNVSWAVHPFAEYVDDVDHDYGTCAVYRCDNCGTTYHVELPD